MLTLDTLNFLAELLSTVQVPASAANFDELAAQVGTARRELIAAIEAAQMEGES